MRRVIIAIITMICVQGCINNDIPYPIIFGTVESMSVEGQTDLKIDATNRIIRLTLSDTVDIRKVKITDLVITKDSRSTLDSGDVIDLSNGVGYAIGSPYVFNITTFQQYDWQIEAIQPIDREIKVSGSIGSALFDNENQSVIVKVSQNQDLYDIKVESFQLGPSVATYSPNPYTISDYSKEVIITMSYFGIEEDWTIDIQHSMENVITGTPNPWSSFAYLTGDVLPTSTAATGFEYKKVGAQDWNVLTSTSRNGTIEGIAKNLDPNTSYVVRAFLGGEYGAEVEFKTDNQPSIPNLNFADAYLDGKVWYFNESGGNSYWSTGNEGIVTAGRSSSTTSVSGNEAVTGKAVRMETYNGIMMVQVAAGNIYTGTYSTKLSLNPVEALKSATFGRPYRGRPTALKGWYRYTPQTITSSSYWQKAAEVFNNNFADSVGKKDWCNIYMTLEKWPDGVDKRPENEALITKIAHGELISNETVPTYKQFTIPMTYYSLTEIPNHVTIVATSSLNGGYFCGAAGSVLYVDDFELIFDYLEQE